ncbi:bifunctional helix-turn-helix transcriptional regulator/GNAT family N-acetyltransferase [Fulvimonas soli]|jgi:DNA-binding MarR family transcriptional regulator/GNAT superfamily N-acetyltransferase|uniref:MarR family transcriptional regulator with acetyltransferase activity n=1 Tax=Fulvimonas soli TaxID=155197 RepID=A0A316IHT3_9GAMM|nr:bifunctional helix-turn-helix transcriptional regulator/GNAT family N-acetyltransferase [Fulvimonas soli]PWK92004.1 MarR family transcriptional regulator with acetyltransferase activity [Fulvimonas soli]TNY27389.1 MarR family transcriptional regulator [Fulvimonas soli]
MSQAVPASHAEALRRFNRFYTRRIGVLDEGLLDSPYTLTQARVLYELAQRGQAAASEIGQALGLDAGYLSRILRGFAAQGLLARKPAPDDRRRTMLSLTAAGRRAFARLDRRSRAQATALLAGLAPAARRRLLGSLRSVQRLLAPDEAPAGRVVIRTHRPGDLGWAIQRHGELYAEEYGWNAEFEALVATLFARFASAHDPAAERCWIAELDGERAGCVFVARGEDDPAVAQLRCLLVDPAARGHGIGRRLVEQCIAFARAAGYPRIRLWTNDVLVAARRIYQAAGFGLVREYPHHSFGADLVGQVWERPL